MVKLPNWFIYLEATFTGQKAKNPEHTAAILTGYFNDWELSEEQRMQVVKEAAVKHDYWSVRRLRVIAKDISSRPSLKEANGIQLSRTEQMLNEMKRLNREREAWPVCTSCGEHTPDLLNCPFCEDIRIMRSEYAGAD